MSGRAQYRRLLRSIDFAFGQDVKALKLARVQLKQEFIKNKLVPQNSSQLQDLMKDVDDIDEMLRFHIVQGKKNEKGSFAVSFRPEHHVTIESEQDRKFGPELTPIDPSFIGQPITVTKVKGGEAAPPLPPTHAHKADHPHNQSCNHKK